MSLFTATNQTPANGTGAIRGPGRRSFGLGTPAVALADAIGRLQPDMDVHFVSAGAWSLHDLIRYAIRKGIVRLESVEEAERMLDGIGDAIAG